MRKYFYFILLTIILSCKKTEVKKTETSAAPLNYIDFTTTPYAMEAEPTTDGGLVYSGFTNTFDGTYYDGFLTKLNSDGKLQWTKKYGGFQDDRFNHAIQSSDGGYMAVGYTCSFGLGASNVDFVADAWIVKTDMNGEVVWEKEIGGYEIDRYFYVMETPDHYFVATGRYNSNNWEYILVTKFDIHGNIIWNQTHTIKQYSFINFGLNITMSPAGEYVVGCYTTKTNNAADLSRYYTYLLCLNPDDGKRTWARQYEQFEREGYFSYQRPNLKVLAVSDGYIIGTYLTYAGGKSKIQVMKTGATGILQWEKQYDNFDNSILGDLMPAEDGGFYIYGGSTKEIANGYYQGSYLEQRNLLCKIDEAGNVQWSRLLGSSQLSTRGVGFTKTSYGFLLGSHAYINNKNKQEIYTLKTDNFGNFIQ